MDNLIDDLDILGFNYIEDHYQISYDESLNLPSDIEYRKIMRRIKNFRTIDKNRILKIYGTSKRFSPHHAEYVYFKLDNNIALKIGEIVNYPIDKNQKKSRYEMEIHFGNSEITTIRFLSNIRDLIRAQETESVQANYFPIIAMGMIQTLQMDTKKLTYSDPSDHIRRHVTYQRDFLDRTIDGEQERNYVV